MGLTGGIASGKSTVAAMLRDLGAPVVDADAIVHRLQAPGGPAYGPIVAAFGPGVVAPDGTLDRRALAARVFADPEARRRLEAIVHPLVRQEMAAAVAALRQAGAPVAVLDVPLLVEGGLYRTVDEVWVVYVDPDTQVRRLMARSGLTEAEARRRIAAQMPLDEKVRYAHVVIDNRGSLAETRAQVERAWRRTLAAAGVAPASAPAPSTASTPGSAGAGPGGAGSPAPTGEGPP